MSDGFPSMTALLGLLALAGYQNRDKLAEMLGGLGQAGPATAGQAGGLGSGLGGGQGTGQAGGQSGGQSGGLGGGLGGLLGSLGGLAGGAGAGGFLHSGLGEMLERFQQNGHGAAAQSWVGHGPNQEIGPSQLEQAIGPDVLAALTQRTGLSRDELLARLSRDLPQAIDRYTPDGRVPAA
ncbi:YidB family protein [Methylobacterium nigriterrae]|uniref:YidB family protein n=1 Tax=Methylobacterium nigriterrae TaxID=3127512 RepID=UPI0030138247